jgi:hypothetical protein
MYNYDFAVFQRGTHTYFRDKGEDFDYGKSQI